MPIAPQHDGGTHLHRSGAHHQELDDAVPVLHTAHRGDLTIGQLMQYRRCRQRERTQMAAGAAADGRHFAAGVFNIHAVDALQRFNGTDGTGAILGDLAGKSGIERRMVRQSHHNGDFHRRGDAAHHFPDLLRPNTDILQLGADGGKAAQLQRICT